MNFYIPDYNYTEGKGKLNPLLKLYNPDDIFDAWTLKFHLTHYFNKKNIDQIKIWASEAKSDNKILYVWHQGDLDPPIFDNVIWLQTSIQPGNNHENRRVIPFFINDPIEKFSYLSKTENDDLSIGFCGYAGSSNFKIAVSTFLNITQRIKPTFYLKPEIIPAVLLRKKILLFLEKKITQTNFILRDKFNAGRKIHNSSYLLEQTTIEYFENMLNNNFVVCIRGYGNFSIRFFETFACGKIPIFFNTACKLPFEDKIDYKKQMIWIDAKDYKKSPQIIKDWYNQNKENLLAIKARNREIWDTYFNEKNFIKQLEYIL